MLRFVVISLFFLLSAVSYGQTVGIITVVFLRNYVSRQVGVVNNVPQYAAQPEGQTWTVIYYDSGTTGRTYETGKTLSGVTPPHPPTSAYTYVIVTGFKHYSVDPSLDNFNLPILGSDYLTSRPLSPIYSGGGDGGALPFIYTENNQALQRNDAFYLSDKPILQGNISSDTSQYNYFVSYDPSGNVYFSSDGQTVATGGGGYNMVWNPQGSESGWSLSAVPVGGSSSTDLSPVVNSVNTQVQSLRDQLVQQLGAAGASWVYDCKLSTEQLYELAVGAGLRVVPDFSDSTIPGDIAIIKGFQQSILNMSDSILFALNNKNFSPVINVNPDITVSPPEVNVSPNITVSPPEVNVAAPEVNVTVEPAAVNVDTSKLATQKTLNDLYTRNHTDLNNVRNLLNNTMLPVLNQIGTVLNGWNSGNQLSNLPQPDFGDDEPNDNLPSSVQDAYSEGGVASDSSVAQVFGQMVDWGNNGAPTMIVPNFMSNFLSTFVGSIPSVGSDSTMFTFDCDIPFVGHINRTFSWSDIPYISDFRALLVWLLYLFFGLACFKLLHKTLI